jgi:hypothetical protein
MQLPRSPWRFSCPGAPGDAVAQEPLEMQLPRGPWDAVPLPGIASQPLQGPRPPGQLEVLVRGCPPGHVKPYTTSVGLGRWEIRDKPWAMRCAILRFVFCLRCNLQPVPNPLRSVLRHTCASSGSPRPAARSHRPKGEILARFKGNNTRRPLFFSACVGMAWHGTSKQHFRSKKFATRSWWSCSVSDCKRQSSNSRRNILPPPLTSFE